MKLRVSSNRGRIQGTTGVVLLCSVAQALTSRAAKRNMSAADVKATSEAAVAQTGQKPNESFALPGTQKKYNSQAPSQLGKVREGQTTGSGQWNAGSKDVASSGLDRKGQVVLTLSVMRQQDTGEANRELSGCRHCVRSLSHCLEIMKRKNLFNFLYSTLLCWENDGQRFWYVWQKWGNGLSLLQGLGSFP